MRFSTAWLEIAQMFHQIFQHCRAHHNPEDQVCIPTERAVRPGYAETQLAPVLKGGQELGNSDVVVRETAFTFLESLP